MYGKQAGSERAQRNSRPALRQPRRLPPAQVPGGAIAAVARRPLARSRRRCGAWFRCSREHSRLLVALKLLAAFFAPELLLMDLINRV
jgi:hypothetical protein